MYLLKDRFATYYARYNVSVPFMDKGFPKELRFSLATKNRAIAIDRLLVVVSFLRREFSKVQSQSFTLEETQHFLQQLKNQLKAIREAHFSFDASPIPSVQTKSEQVASTSIQHEQAIATKPITSVAEQLTLFIQSKKLKGVLPRTMQQLESRVSKFIRFAGRVFENWTEANAIDFRDGLLAKGQSDKSVIEYLAACRQFLKWLKIRGLISKNIFDEVTHKGARRKASDSREVWRKCELDKLLKHTSLDSCAERLHHQTELENYWVPRLLLATGARVSEICQLDVADIKLIDDIWCIDINENTSDKRLKSAAASRTVPLHPSLIKDGLLQYAEQRYQAGCKKLFSFKPLGAYRDWSKTFVNRFSKLLDELGFMPTYRPTLHGLRHKFVNDMQALGISENLVADIVGHAKPNITYGRYAKASPVKIKHQAICQLIV